MATTHGRLSEPSQAPTAGESISVLARGPGWRVEQILSGALAEPVDDCLDHDEWVVVLDGGAVLDVDGSTVSLTTGQWLHLRTGTPHRVLSTSTPTSWLAFHVGGTV